MLIVSTVPVTRIAVGSVPFTLPILPPPDAVTVLLTESPVEVPTPTVNENISLLPAAIGVEFVQLTDVVPVQVHPGAPAKDVALRPVGSASVTVSKPPVGPGPALETVTLMVPVPFRTKLPL